MAYHKNELFYLEKRRIIYNFIKDNPGLYFRKLSRLLKIPKTTLEYHLRYLQNRELIRTEIDGKYKRYFSGNNIGCFEKKVLSSLRNSISRGIIFITYRYTGVYRETISEVLEIPITTISYHLKNLKELNIIMSHRVKRKMAYTLNNRKYIYDILIKYENSFSDDPIFDALMVYINEIIPNGKDPIKSYNEEQDEVSDLIDLFFKVCPIPFRA